MTNIKTTISIDKELWTEFSIKVLRNKGGRKKNEILTDLIKEYISNKTWVFSSSPSPKDTATKILKQNHPKSVKE